MIWRIIDCDDAQGGDGHGHASESKERAVGGRWGRRPQGKFLPARIVHIRY